jgi:hypothetical protein
MSSCISASGIVNQRQKHPRARPMLGETIRRASRDGRSAHPTHLAPGPPRETSEHATPGRKTPYAHRKTRTPRPGGQGVHSEPSGAPVSRAPFEGRDDQLALVRATGSSALILSTCLSCRGQQSNRPRSGLRRLSGRSHYPGRSLPRDCKNGFASASVIAPSSIVRHSSIAR